MALVKLGSSTVSTTTSVVTFSSIPQTYKHLYMRGRIKNTGASQNPAYLYYYFNGVDTNGRYLYARQNGSSLTATDASASGQGFLLLLAAWSSDSSEWGVFEMYVYDYASTSHYKNAIASSYGNYGSDTAHSLGTTHNTNAITSTSFATQNGNITVGSTFDIYGIV